MFLERICTSFFQASGSPSHWGPSVNRDACFGFGASRGCAGGRLGVVRAALTPGDDAGNRQCPHFGSNEADGGAVFPVVEVVPAACVGPRHASGFVPPWVFLLPSTVSRVMKAEVQAHPGLETPLKMKVSIAVPHTAGFCSHSVWDL